VSRHFTGKVTSLHTDHATGRSVSVLVEPINGAYLAVHGVYAPNVNSDRRHFFNKLSETLDNLSLEADEANFVRHILLGF
jgi:hypothetical protein